MSDQMTGETQLAVFIAHNQFFRNQRVRIVARPAAQLALEEVYSPVNSRDRLEIGFSTPARAARLVIDADRMAASVVGNEALLMDP